MQENDFEKQVQQKMEELSFVPSGPVWQKIELQIRKEKRKRRLILFLLPLLLLTGSGIWYATSSNNKNAQIVPDNRNVKNKESGKSEAKKLETAKDLGAPITTHASNLQPEKKEAVSNTIARNTNRLKQKENETFLKPVDKTNRKEIKSSATPLPPVKKKESFVNEELHALILEKKESALAREKSAYKKNVSQHFFDSAANKKHTAVSQRTPDSLTNNIAANDVVININTPEKDSVAEENVVPPMPSTTKAIKNKSKWEWTATTRAGASHLRSGMLQVFSNERADNLYASPATGNNNPSTGSGGFGNTAPFAISNEIENGFAFSMSASVRKRLFQNAFVVAGLQYSRYSTQAYVGTKLAVDTALNYNGRSAVINGYYKATGPPSKYTTRYHYLELPIAVEYCLFKKVPLQLQHGISAGYLFSTNALYYDGAARILYKNDQWLRKVGLNVFTSVDYRLFNTPSFSFYLGPQVQWGITPLQKAQEPKKHYLFFAGLQSRIAF